MSTTVGVTGDASLDRPLLKMSELAERSGVSAGTIRYYLREGLLGEGADIVRTSRNMAYYPPEYVQRIELIKRLQEKRFMPLRVIKGALQEDPERVHALIELEDRILERALASAEDSKRVSLKAVRERYEIPRNVLERLAGEVEVERAMEIVAAGVEPLRELLGAMHSKLLLAELRRQRASAE